jgi:hypothetical protein
LSAIAQCEAIRLRPSQRPIEATQAGLTAAAPVQAAAGKLRNAIVTTERGRWFGSLQADLLDVLPVAGPQHTPQSIYAWRCSVTLGSASIH